MKIGTENLQVSMTVALADAFRATGYNIKWHETKQVETHTSSGSTVGTVTLVPTFPATAEHIVMKSTDHPDDIEVPAFSLLVLETPRRGAILGLGHKDYYWSRELRIDGFCRSEHEQRLIMDMLHDHYQSEEGKQFVIRDYSAEGEPELGVAEVEYFVGASSIFAHESKAVRWYVRGEVVLRYVE